MKYTVLLRTETQIQMHSDFDPNKVNWLALINAADDKPHQYGGSSYTPFVGLPYQRGAGIGSIFRSLLRFLIPIGREAGKAIGRQGLESGVRVMSGVLDGQDLRQSLEHEGRAGLKNLLDKASNNLAKRQEATQSGGSSAFDFKRYKKQLGPSANLTTFHQQPAKKPINSRGKRNLLQSTIGPSLLPTLGNKRKAKSNSNGKRNKKVRIDSLGVY